MKFPKYIWFLLTLIMMSMIEYYTKMNVYIITVITGAILYGISEAYNSQYETQNKKENRELQEEIRSTAKDAHLKNKQLLTVVSSIPFPMLLIDQFGNIVMHNNIKEIAIGEDIKNTMTYMSNPYVHSVREFIKDAFILEKALDSIIKIHDIEYQAMSVPVTAKNKYSGCLVLFQDISKTLEGEKMQKRFIADASHELKTPISVIKGMVEILNREDFDDTEIEKEFLIQMETEINRLDLLVKDLLQLSRLSLSNVILEREKVDIQALIEKACKSLEKSAIKKQLLIKREYQTSEFAFCDPKKMLQVLLNLLSNAIKYSDKGTITFLTRVEGNHFIITVKDEGHGIKKIDQDKIYERFYRVDDDRSRQSGGSGLGLSIVKSIIDAHGGTLVMQSKVGYGSEFIIKLKN